MSYNGWKNYETWNVSLWMLNHEPLYLCLLNASMRGMSWEQLAEEMREAGVTETPDKVAFNDTKLSHSELNKMIQEATQ